MEGLRDRLDGLVFDMYEITDQNDRDEVLTRGAPLD